MEENDVMKIFREIKEKKEKYGVLGKISNDKFMNIWNNSRKELLKELIQLCDDYSKDCIDLYELKLLLEDYN